MAVPLFDRRLILVLGKGGVGRSTVSASIAAECAGRGRRTLLYQANANDRFAEIFGAEPIDTEIRRIAKNLYSVNTNPGAALEEYGLMVLKFRRVYNLVFENRLIKAFIRAVPGMEDYAILGKAWFHTTETKGGRAVWDTLVFDMPASGHSLSMLRIPGVITRTVPEGPLTRDAKKLAALLGDQERTGVVLVTLAEEMPTNEATELAGVVTGELGISIDSLVVNQLYPDRFPAGGPARDVIDALARAAALDPELAVAGRQAGMTQARREIQLAYLEELGRRIDAPQTELPFLFTGSIGRGEVESLRTLLTRSIDG